MKAFEAVEVEWQNGNHLHRPLPAELQAGQDPLVWRRYGVGDWLLHYDCVKDVEDKWSEVCARPHT